MITDDDKQRRLYELELRLSLTEDEELRNRLIELITKLESEDE